MRSPFHDPFQHRDVAKVYLSRNDVLCIRHALWMYVERAQAGTEAYEEVLDILAKQLGDLDDEEEQRATQP